jgi:cobaltochelatase CobT
LPITRTTLDKDIRPPGGDASAIYEAAEQARVEAIGANAMAGVKANLAAILAMRCKAHGLGDVKEQIQAPLVDVLGLMVRERLTGEAPPPIARRAVDLWRPFVEAKVGLELDKLKDSIRDQRSYGKLTRAILTGLELADEYVEEPEGEERIKDDSDRSKANPTRSRKEKTASPRRSKPNDKDSSEAGEEETVRRCRPTLPIRESQETRGRQAPAAPRPALFDVERWDYKVFTTQFDEIINAEDLCDAEELGAA